MATKFLEAGTDETFDLTFFTTNTGTVASDSVNANTGPRSIKFTSGSGGAIAYVNKGGIVSDAGARISFYVRFNDLPLAALDFFLITVAGDGQNLFSLGISTAGQIFLARWNLGEIQVATGSILSTGVWYRLAFAYTITSATVNETRVYLNGVLDMTASNSAIASTGSSDIDIGWVNSSSGNLKIINVDDIYVDDSSALTDPGNIHVTAKRPFANGTTNGFTTQIGAGGSGYGTGHAPQVNERPLSVTNGWSMIGAGSAVTEEYSIEGLSVGDVDLTGATIVDFTGWAYAKALVSETGQLILANVNGNISLTNTNTLFTRAAGSSTYPGGGTDIGIITATTVTTVSLYECGVLVAYTPAAVAEGGGTMIVRPRLWVY